MLWPTVDDERPSDEPDANIEHNAYRGVTWDDWAKLAVRVRFIVHVARSRFWRLTPVPTVRIHVDYHRRKRRSQRRTQAHEHFKYDANGYSPLPATDLRARRYVPMTHVEIRCADMNSACAMWEDKYEEALEEFRKIIAARGDESEPIRIFQAMCNSGLPSLDAIVNTKLQKYILRRCGSAHRPSIVVY